MKEPEYTTDNMLADFCAVNLRRIDRGITPGAQGFLQGCISGLRQERPLHPDEAAALANMLQRILDAKSPWDVPLLRRKRGQKNADDSEDQSELAFWIASQMRNGSKRDVAYLEVAALFYPGKSKTFQKQAAQRAWRNFKHKYK